MVGHFKPPTSSLQMVGREWTSNCVLPGRGTARAPSVCVAWSADLSSLTLENTARLGRSGSCLQPPSAVGKIPSFLLWALPGWVCGKEVRGPSQLSGSGDRRKP